MIIKTFRWTFQIIGALGIILVAAGGYASWLLSKGPISISLANPYLEQALSARDGSFQVRIKDTVLAWAGWQRNLDIRVVDVRVVDAKGGLVATAPEFSVTLSGRALLHKVLALRAIEVLKPSLHLNREVDGRLSFGFGGEALTAENTDTQGQTQEIVQYLFNSLNNSPDAEQPLSFLSRIRIVDANFTVHDRTTETSWWAPGTEILVEREPDGIKAEVNLEARVEGRVIEIGAIGGYRRDVERFDFGLDFAGVDPVLASRLAPELAPLSAFDFLIGGTVTGSLDRNLRLKSTGFDVTGGQGTLDLPAPAAQRLELTDAHIKGTVDWDRRDLSVSKFKIAFAPGSSVDVPAPINHTMPLSSIVATGTYNAESNSLHIPEIGFGLRGPTAKAVITVEGIGGNMTLSSNASLFGVPVNKIPKYWPASLGTDAHTWVRKHLRNGTVHRADTFVKLFVPEQGEPRIDSLHGQMEMSGITVDYLPPMPKVKDTSGTATFNGERFDIAVKGGTTADGLVVQSAQLAFTELNTDDPQLDIAIDVEGPIRSAMELINSEPLVLADKLGIEPSGTGGVGKTQLRLGFPLLRNLTLDDIRFSARSVLNDVTVLKPILGLDLTRGRLDLGVDNDGMDLAGEVDIGSIPVDLRWRKNFGDRLPFRDRYTVRGAITDGQLVGELALDFPPFTGGYIRGGVDADLSVTRYDDGQTILIADLGLARAALRTPMLNWTKAPGRPATARLDVLFKDNHVRQIRRFDIEAEGLAASGSAFFKPQSSEVRQITFERIMQGRNDTRLVMAPRDDGGWDVDVSGEILDLQPFRDSLFDNPQPDADPAADDGMPPVTASINIGKVWLHESRSMERVTGALDFYGEVWRSARLDGTLRGGEQVHLTITPEADNKRRLEVTSLDAGEALRTLDVFDTMVGGEMVLSGLFDDRFSESRIEGALVVEKFRVVNAPVLAHILSIASLTGILDSLGGDGLAFSKLDVPYIKKGDVFAMKDGQAFGLSLGITGSGQLNLATDVINIEGTIVPAYSVNSILGKIPVLGKLVTGGEKGSGLFAVTYRVSDTMSKPKATVQPLTALAPGFLRKLFEIKENPAPKSP